MRTITVRKGSGEASNYTTGWHTLTISKARYGDYNGTKLLDVWFKDYPDNFNCRIYETINTATQEEFRISSWFRFTQAGIQEVLDNDDPNKSIITYDDDASLLAGKPVNIYVHPKYSEKHDRSFGKPWHESAPH